MKQLLKTSNYVNYNRLSTAHYSKLLSAGIIAKGCIEALLAHGIGNGSRGLAECNICKWRGRKFLNFYSGYNHVYKNAVCPNCYSHPRHRSYSISLKEIFKERNGPMKVLHFSPERHIAWILSEYQNVEYLSADIDHRKAMRKEDICNLSFKDDSFDVIICIHVFEHIDDDRAAMEQIYRVLKPNGIALLDVPIDTSRKTTYEDPDITSPEERTREFWQWDHVRLYGLDYPDKLRAVGFKVEEKRLIHSLDTKLIQKHGLDVSPNYLCFK